MFARAQILEVRSIGYTSVKHALHGMPSTAGALGAR